MATTNTRFEEAQAKQWQIDVKSELDTTNTLLKEIYPVLETYDEEDDVLNAMKSVGETLEGKFVDLCGAFETSIDVIDGAIKKMGEFIAKLINDIGTSNSSVKQ